MLELAAKDFITAGKKGEKAIVLVSDGKETCDGDPCATAAALAAADIELSIHAIGFEVDLAARKQLQCIAKVARGSYADAGDAAQLAAALRQAVVAKMEPVAPLGKEPGNLKVKGADLIGREVSNMAATLPLPPGDYTVDIGGTAVPFTIAEGQTVTLSAK